MYGPVAIPFAIKLYGTSTTTFNVSTNGVSNIPNIFFAVHQIDEHQIVGLTAPSPLSTAYSNAALPQAAVCNTCVFALWDDLFIQKGTSQGIFYQIDGVSPSRTLTVEFYTTQYNAYTNYYHWQTIFYEARPDIVMNKYLNITDSGVSATVGIQSISGEETEGKQLRVAIDADLGFTSGQTIAIFS